MACKFTDLSLRRRAFYLLQGLAMDVRGHQRDLTDVEILDLTSQRTFRTRMFSHGYGVQFCFLCRSLLWWILIVFLPRMFWSGLDISPY